MKNILIFSALIISLVGLLFFSEDNAGAIDPDRIEKNSKEGFEKDVFEIERSLTKDQIDSDDGARQEKPSTSEIKHSMPTLEAKKSGSEYDVLPILDPHMDDQSRSNALHETSEELRFQNEPYDNEWAALAEGDVWEKYTASGIKDSDLQSVDCRTSICKIRVAHADDNARAAFLGALIAHVGNNQGAVYDYIDDEGKYATLIYRYR